MNTIKKQRKATNLLHKYNNELKSIQNIPKNKSRNKLTLKLYQYVNILISWLLSALVIVLYIQETIYIVCSYFSSLNFSISISVSPVAKTILDTGTP